MKLKLKKYESNPIFTANSEIDWEKSAVFNCGVIFKNDKFHMLYRAIGEYELYISRLGYAVSEDGILFKRSNPRDNAGNPLPVLYPEHEYEKYGCEDPRIMEIDGKIYITYVGLKKPARVGGGPPKTACAITQDFYSYKKLGIITPEFTVNKDVVLFPRKFKNKFVMLHRPSNWVKKNVIRKNNKIYIKYENNLVEWQYQTLPDFPDTPSIFIACSKDLKNWENHQLLFEGTEEWENSKTGAGAPPILTKYGWLLLYHGVEHKNGKNIYSAGFVLLDSDNPYKVVYRSKEPILEPALKYETEGDVEMVVFPEGAVLKENNLYVYYGGGDKCINLATGTLI